MRCQALCKSLAPGLSSARFSYFANSNRGKFHYPLSSRAFKLNLKKQNSLVSPSKTLKRTVIPQTNHTARSGPGNAHILCLGLNHRTAGVSLRERLPSGDEAVKASLARLGCGGGLENLHELVILSTCSRVEVYAAADRLAFDVLQDLLLAGAQPALFAGEPASPPASAGHFYRLADAQAVEHLLRVAAGLDSVVLGEPQILGQVMHALELARGQGASGPLLDRLFETALRAGKRVRAETAISHNPASISSIAAALVEQVVPDLAGARLLVVGAGEMAELAVEALRKRGVQSFQVLNRTRQRAALLAGRWGGQALTFEQLPAALAWADMVISSTGAPHPVISAAVVRAALAQRTDRPLVLVDIAVPRDIDPAAGALPGVRLYDLDDLHARLDHSLALRQQAAPHAGCIVQEVLLEFLQYRQQLEVFPLIAELHQRAETIRQAELEKTLRHMPDLSAQERDRLDALTHALVKKLLHAPTARLRTAAGGPQAAGYAEAARVLFDLEAQIASGCREYPL